MASAETAVNQPHRFGFLATLRSDGWWVEPGREPLTEALRSAMALSDAERRAMGERGRRLVTERYSWAKIAAEMRAVYQWVLGNASKPACLEECS